MPRRPNEPQPTDAQVDAADQAATRPVPNDERFDEPSVDDLLQAVQCEPVKVEVAGPVNTDELPTFLGGVRTFSLAVSGAGVKIANADPRRKSITIYSPDGDWWIGGSQADVEQSAGFYVGGNVPLTLTVRDELWVRNAEAAVIRLSVLVEQWAR